MRNTHPRYTCFPSVVCAGKETEVAITPRDLSRSFRTDKVYHVAVTGLDEDSFSFDDPIVLDKHAENGWNFLKKAWAEFRGGTYGEDITIDNSIIIF